MARWLGPPPLLEVGQVLEERYDSHGLLDAALPLQ
jgi:hypothetical protein